MNRPILNVAIVGCGRVAGHHATFIADMADARLVAVCDLVAERARDFGAKFGVPAFTDYHAMLRTHPEADTVAIVTPSGMHAEHAMDVMRRYRRSVIVEKPTFMRPEQAEEAFALADALGLDVFPVFQNRYNKAVRRVRAGLDAGELGDIRVMNVRLRWCRPQRYYDMAAWRGTLSHDGGVLTNQGIHHVDLLRHLGGEVARVSATMRTMGAAIEAEDTAVATIVMNSDAIGSLEATTAARPDDFEASLSIVGSKGLAQIGGVGCNELQIFTPDSAACAGHSEQFLGIEGKGAVYGHGHGEMYQDIVRFRRDGVAYPVTRQDCLGTLRLLHAFYRSAEADGAWTEPGPAARHLGRPNEAVSALYRTPVPADEAALS